MSGTFDEVAWSSWRPNVVATLLFVVADGRILLIRKKRGLGAGKVNGPGGKVDPGETPLEAACREVEEEVGVTVEDVVACGELSFQFVDGLALHCHVFRSPGLRGVLRETDEAAPFWASARRPRPKRPRPRSTPASAGPTRLAPASRPRPEAHPGSTSIDQPSIRSASKSARRWKRRPASSSGIQMRSSAHISS